MKEKKQSDVAVLLNYAGSYKKLTYLGLVFLLHWLNASVLQVVS